MDNVQVILISISVIDRDFWCLIVELFGNCGRMQNVQLFLQEHKEPTVNVLPRVKVFPPAHLPFPAKQQDANSESKTSFSPLISDTDFGGMKRKTIFISGLIIKTERLHGVYYITSSKQSTVLNFFCKIDSIWFNVIQLWLIWLNIQNNVGNVRLKLYFCLLHFLSKKKHVVRIKKKKRSYFANNLQT